MKDAFKKEWLNTSARKETQLRPKFRFLMSGSVLYTGVYIAIVLTLDETFQKVFTTFLP